jgi:hypothetical protein
MDFHSKEQFKTQRTTFIWYCMARISLTTRQMVEFEPYLIMNESISFSKLVLNGNFLLMRKQQTTHDMKFLYKTSLLAGCSTTSLEYTEFFKASNDQWKFATALDIDNDTNMAVTIVEKKTLN